MFGFMDYTEKVCPSQVLPKSHPLTAYPRLERDSDDAIICSRGNRPGALSPVAWERGREHQNAGLEMHIYEGRIEREEEEGERVGAGRGKNRAISVTSNQ